ncbi:hypothetical protein VC154_24205, partial [Citrobacter freundii]|nr:hypothetical protein [Citrobacter freundii]
MSLWLSIVTRATGLPDKRYLNDPVIFRYYQQKIQKAPFALVGWTLCFLATIGVSLGLELSNQILLLVLLILFLLMVVLQSRYQFMHPERCISAGLAPIFPYTFYHLTHYWFAAADIPV